MIISLALLFFIYYDDAKAKSLTPGQTCLSMEERLYNCE